MNKILLIPTFFFIQLCVGRAGSIYYGITVFDKWYTGAIIIVAFDVFQIIFFNFIYGIAERWRFVDRFWRIIKINIKKFLRKSRIKRALKKERTLHSRMLVRAQRWGQLGVIVIAAIPFIGGGMWSGVLLARILKLSRLRGAVLLMTGSIFSCVVLSVGYYNIRLFIINLFS